MILFITCLNYKSNLSKADNHFNCVAVMTAEANTSHSLAVSLAD